jgi:hypothetical protein
MKWPMRLSPASAVLAGPCVLATACFLAATPATAQDPLPSAQQIIHRYVEAIGGRDAVLGHTSSRSTGTFSLPAAGISGTLLAKSAAPNLSVLQVEIPGLGTSLTGFDGEVGWSVDPNMGARLLEGAELAALKEGSSQLAGIRDPSLFQEQETVERAEMNGEACYKVRMLWKSGRETFDCFSVETGLLVGSVSRQSTPMGEIDVVTLMDGYRDTGGVLSATRIRQQMLGQEQVMTLDTVEYDVVEPEAFHLPEVIRALIRGRQDG